MTRRRTRDTLSLPPTTKTKRQPPRTIPQHGTQAIVAPPKRQAGTEVAATVDGKAVVRQGGKRPQYHTHHTRGHRQKP